MNSIMVKREKLTIAIVGCYNTLLLRIIETGNKRESYHANGFDLFAS
jgi:hypothetical protein